MELSEKAAREPSPDQRDVLDAAVYALEEAIRRQVLYGECVTGTWYHTRAGEKSYCSRCGLQH